MKARNGMSMGPVATEDWAAAIAASPPLQREAEASVALDGDTQSDPEPVEAQPEPPTPQQIVAGIGRPVLLIDGRYHCPICNISYDHPQALGPHMRVHWQEAGVALADIPNGDDTVRCPECDIRLTRRGLATGHLAHKHGYDPAVATGVARIAGFNLDAYLNPPPPPEVPNYEARQQQLVDCPYTRCGATHKRKYMRRHLESIHGVDSNDAIKRTRNLVPSRRTESAPSKQRGGNRPGPKPQAQSPAVVEHANGASVVPPEPEQTTTPGQPGIDWVTIAPTDIAIGVVQSQINGHLPSGLIPDVIEYVDRTREVIAKLRATRG